MPKPGQPELPRHPCRWAATAQLHHCDLLQLHMLQLLCDCCCCLAQAIMHLPAPAGQEVADDREQTTASKSGAEMQGIWGERRRLCAEHLAKNSGCCCTKASCSASGRISGIRPARISPGSTTGVMPLQSACKTDA